MKKLVIGFIFGIALTVTTSVYAESIKEYILTKVQYPIFVNGEEYVNNDLPVLNYEGNTYVPLKAIGDVLEAKVSWNDKLLRVEIGKNSLATEQPTNAVIQPEVIKDYLKNESSPALRYQGEIYLPIRAGAEKYDLLPSFDQNTKLLTFDKTNITISINEKFEAGVDGFIYNGTSYIKESIFIVASNEMLSTPEDTQVNTQLNYLQLNTPYTASDNGMTVTVHSIIKAEKEGFNEYTITYEQVNNTKDKKIDEATFNIYYKNGDAESQYGFFGTLMPTERITRSYTFKALKGQEAYSLEYGVNIFFSKTPSNSTLKWQVD